MDNHIKPEATENSGKVLMDKTRKSLSEISSNSTVKLRGDH